MFKFRQLLWIFLIFSLMYGANNVHGQSARTSPGKALKARIMPCSLRLRKAIWPVLSGYWRAAGEIGARNSEDQTPLMPASAEGHVNVVTLLIN